MYIHSSILLSITLSSSLLTSEVINGAKYDDVDEELLLSEVEQLRVSELGSNSEESLNCFLQLDQSLADKWAKELNLSSSMNYNDGNGQAGDSNIDKNNEQAFPTVDKSTLLGSLNNCMSNITKKLKNPVLKKCMNDLIRNEIESDDFISLPELFDDTLPLPFLTFFDIREIAKLLFDNRTFEELNEEEVRVFQTASNYLKKYNSGRDKVFVIDQSCDWKNLAVLKNFEKDTEKQLKEFKEQVLRSTSLQVAHGIFIRKDLKPGTWVEVYRRWSPVRLQNIKDLDSLTKDLHTSSFTTEELCRYATTLGTFFAEQELNILLPEKLSPIDLSIDNLRTVTINEENRLCQFGVTRECATFREMNKLYQKDSRCVKTFAELLSNHLLYAIIQKYANVEPKITYPEIACKKNSSSNKISIRYCRCVGSFCTSRDVGEIRANNYKLINGIVTKV